MVTGQIDIPTEQIEAFCRKWRITELALFGSVLRDDFRPDSDVDVLVTFAPDSHWSLWDIVEAQQELETILGRKVDLVEKKWLTNPFRRYSILTNKQVIYGPSGR